jgi:integrase
LPVVPNPVRLLKREVRKRHARSEHNPEDVPWCDAANIARVYNAMPEGLRVAYLVGALAGLRPSEVCGLQWADLDEERHTISVVRQRAAKGEGTTPPKSGKSRSAVLTAELTAVLREHRLRCGSSTWCFLGPRGKGLLRLRTLEEAFAKVRDELGDLPRDRKTGEAMTLYQATRHSYASCYVSAGGSLTLLAARLGHSTPQITTRYAHLTPDHVEERELGLVAVDLAPPEGKVLSLPTRGDKRGDKPARRPRQASAAK